MDSLDFLMLMRCVLMGIFQEASPELEQLGLQPKTFALLVSLPKHPFPNELAKHLFVPAPTITFLLKQLEKLELVRRGSDAKDLRRYRIELTAKGKKAVKKAQEVLSRVMKRRLSRLSSAERSELLSALRILQAPDEGRA